MRNLFDNISLKNKEKILRLLQASNVKYSKNINIIPYMDRYNTIGIVEYGSVQIILNDYNGNTTLIDEYKANDIFGSAINSIILNDECSIITKEETKISFIDYDKVTNSEIIKNDFYIKFIQNFLNIISEQISFKNERIQVLTKKTTRDKLLEYFRILSQKKNSRIFTIPMTFTDLAGYLSVDRCSMTREIKNLKEEGFIKIENKRVTLKY